MQDLLSRVSLLGLLFTVNACSLSSGYLSRTAAAELTATEPSRMEHAPPPFLPRAWNAESPAERRAKAKSLVITGGIVSGLGAAFMLTGGVLYHAPVSCDTSKDWFCDLPQRVAGMGFLIGGAVNMGAGAILLGSGAYKALGFEN
jgi:hypothetical protein